MTPSGVLVLTWGHTDISRSWFKLCSKWEMTALNVESSDEGFFDDNLAQDLCMDSVIELTTSE